MPTTIHFTGGEKITVQEEPDEVFKAVPDKQVIRVTDRDSDRTLFVNIETIAWWGEAPSREAHFGG